MACGTHGIRKYLFRVFFFSLCLILLSCETMEDRDRSPAAPETGQLTIFLNGPRTASSDLSFLLSSLAIVAEDGSRSEVLSAPVNVNSFQIKGRQVALGEISIPEGRYSGLEIRFKEASVRTNGRVSDLALPSGAMAVPIRVTVARRINTSLFLQWNADASVKEGYFFEPDFAVREEMPELRTYLIYVSNENSNNVTVINRYSGEVVATIMVGKRPRGIGSTLEGEHQKIFVANSGSNSISVIDATTNRVEQEVPVRLGQGATDLAVARISGGRELLFIANFLSDSVSIFDAVSFQEIEKVDVGRGPVAIATDPPGEALGSMLSGIDDINTLRSFRNQYINVYVANRNSNSVSVIRVNSRIGKSDEVTHLAVDWQPESISVDYRRGRIYVANYGSDKLSVLNIIEIVKGNTSAAVRNISHVGYNVKDVIADPAFDRLYVLKESPGEIVILRLFQDEFGPLTTITPPVVGKIPVGRSPASFVLDPENRKFYVVNRGANSVSVIDKVAGREDRTIPVGAYPADIAMFTR